MRSDRKKPWHLRLLQRYRRIPRQLRSRHADVRARAQRLIALSVCVPVMLLCTLYLVDYALGKARIERENAAYRALYRPDVGADSTAAPAASASPAPSAAPAPSASPASSVPPAASAALAQNQTSVAFSIATQTPAPSVRAESVPKATSVASSSPAVPTQNATKVGTSATSLSTPTATAASQTIAPAPSFEVAVDATRAPRATPDADTLVYAIETPPPAQSSFADLLALNPDTVGYLTIGDTISLPVVQRKNDNDYYLSHSFEQQPSNAGTLFLDGANLLVPEDPSLIVYGHNMRNGTMFHALSAYTSLDYLKSHALARFDTIYQNRSYVPFAVFSAAVDEGAAGYLNLRRFVFEPDEYALFVYDMRALSIFDIPVEVDYGDSILLLVTCEYSHDDGRFVVALRALREGETEAQMSELIGRSRKR